jgi:hypothetical protein
MAYPLTHVLPDQTHEVSEVHLVMTIVAILILNLHPKAHSNVVREQNKTTKEAP